ncbi:MAG: Glycosyltransferase involved in cell wall bisynthesis [Verrucomicrobia bacterium]|nr:MAG: Glycosyltransferase involved in cell wall bisynthesis [Verrucomicrobiota bacterium]
MKLTFVTDTYAPQLNGVARTLERLVIGLRDRGHRVDLVRPAVLKAQEEGMEVMSFPLPGYEGIHVGFPTVARLLSRWHRERPDIVYVATETLLGFAAIHSARTLGIPVVTGYHTNFQQYLSYYHMPRLEPIAMAYLRYLHNLSARTYVPCEDVLEALGGEGFGNLALLPKGVDTDLFHPGKRDESLRREWGAGPGDPVAIYVGRLAAEKNLPLVVRAMEAMGKVHPGFKGVLVGEGPKRAELEAAYPAGIFVGPKFGEDVARHYASADLFIFASETETFGNVVLEAMASGLAVVAYSYAAARRHVRHGVNGFTAPFSDEEAFLACCVQALDQRDWGELRAAARTEALGVCWERVIDNFQESLRELVDVGAPEQACSPAPLD